MKLPRNVHAFIDRHGRSRFYLRRKGHKKVPLPGLPWTPQFMEVYAKALERTGKIEIGAERTIVGTVNAAVVAYYKSHDFTRDISRARKQANAR